MTSQGLSRKVKRSGRRATKKAYQWVFDRLSLYLPLLLMILLALGTYWLVRSTSLFSHDAPRPEARHDPDYVMDHFFVKMFDNTGHLQSELLGDQARHYPDNDTLEVDNVRILNYNPSGYLTVATGLKGISNSDGSDVQLIGNAQVLRDATVDNQGLPLPRVRFRSEYLHAFLNDERVVSNKPVELIHGDSRIQAESMDFNKYDRVIELHGRVRGVLMPRGPVSDIQVGPAQPQNTPP